MFILDIIVFTTYIFVVLAGLVLAGLSIHRMLHKTNKEMQIIYLGFAFFGIFTSLISGFWLKDVLPRLFFL